MTIEIDIDQASRRRPRLRAEALELAERILGQFSAGVELLTVELGPPTGPLREWCCGRPARSRPPSSQRAPRSHRGTPPSGSTSRPRPASSRSRAATCETR